jgi:hypothetical protein
MSDINETLKKKIDELDLDRRLNEQVGKVRGTVELGLAKLAERSPEDDGSTGEGPDHDKVD